MINTKLRIGYVRLSRDDEQQGESNSITNQKALIEDAAARNGHAGLIFMSDDGLSGTRWDRPGIMQLMSEVAAGNVSEIYVKDLSRLGRDHLRVGLLLEQFIERGVRFIAVNDGVDTLHEMDDFLPFRNIMNEFSAKDTSRKIRAIFNAKTDAGIRTTGAIVYGYIHDPNDRKKWIIDEEAAIVVKRMFQSVIDGKGIQIIANELNADGIPTPAIHWHNIGAGMKKPFSEHTIWAASTVGNILLKEEYMGWTVLKKSVKETYKSKRKPNAPENRNIIKDTHPAIIDEETWTTVQRLRQTKRRYQKDGGEPNPLTGIMICRDCGQKMSHKRGSCGAYNPPHNEYICSSYRHWSRSCTQHHIRVSVVEDLILTAVRRVCHYVRENEQLFVERVRESSALQQDTAIKESHKKLNQSKRRRDEVSSLVKKLYESYALEKIPEDMFSELLEGYKSEQAKLVSEIAELQTTIDNYNTDSVRADKFIELVKRHTEFSEYSTVLLNEFVEKVVVHEAVKIDRTRTQDVEIYFTFIGKFDAPLLPEEILAEEEPPKKRKHKRRFEMTLEELAMCYTVKDVSEKHTL
jgi:DNA invertase Pin-like site-specific DNA recombinase